MDFDFYMPVKVLSGKDAVLKHADIFSMYGKSCLIVTGGNSARLCGALTDVQTALAKAQVEFHVFSEITQNPSVESCAKGGQLARDYAVDFIIGIGGGSAMDAAKAIAVYATNKTLAPEDIFTASLFLPPLPTLLVGTTSGTGSEVSGTAVLTRTNGTKKSVNGKNYYAKVSFADPKYTYSLPQSVLISTVLDALCHATEGWFSNRVGSLAFVFAQKVLPDIYSALELFAKGETLSGDVERDILYYASLGAGMVLNACGTGFPHAMGYVLTEDFDIPHGRACAAFLPEYVSRGMAFKDVDARAYFSLIGTNFPEFQKTIFSLANVQHIHMTPEQIEAYKARWENLKNFTNSPGGYTALDAGALLEKLF